jgi:DNA-binding MarR family transcriptional regulator
MVTTEDAGGQTGRIVSAFRGALTVLNEDNMTVAMGVTLLTVALYPDRSLREYRDLLDMPQSTMSRHMLDLGELNRRRLPGLNLVEQRPDVTDRRKNVYRLTAKGRARIASVTRALGVLQS